MSDAFRYAIPHDRIHTGTIGAVTLTPSDIVFHPGLNETRFTAKGMIYRGELVEDAGAAHALLIAILSGKALPPPAAAASPFPERDPDRTAEQQGLFRKFDVRRTDGSDAPGGKHHGCRYFVIDLDHDQYAGQAMRAYAAGSAATHPKLAEELRAQFGWDENDVIVDRRDIFDSLRTAWRAGNDHSNHLEEGERWQLATDHATAAILGWPTLEDSGSYARDWQRAGADTPDQHAGTASMRDVSQLTGASLDYWAARADNDFSPPSCGSPSEDWAWGGTIIDRERIEVSPLVPMRGGTGWRARCQSRDGRSLYCVNGPTPLIAAMRAFVTCVFGDTVPEIPA